MHSQQKVPAWFLSWSSKPSSRITAGVINCDDLEQSDSVRNPGRTLLISYLNEEDYDRGSKAFGSRQP